jgi:outer membrane protein OmpA-like peptidoglycan-associated protein
MALELGRLPKHAARLAAVLAIAGGLGACSSMPNWVDPTNWFGGETETSAEQIDQSAAQTTADNSPTPDLADMPNKPTAPSTPDEQKQVSDTLQADRSHNQYSGDALRGGTEAAAPPPPASPPPTQVADATPPGNTPPPTPAPAADQTASAPAPQPAASPSDGADNGAIDATGGPSTGQTTPAPAPAAPAPSVSASSNAAVPAVGPAPSAAPTTQVAMAEQPAMTPPPSSGGEPAVPAVGPSSAVPGAQPPTSDSDLGFQPSKAPPLDPSVSQFVPAPIIARYQQTASTGPGAAPAPYDSSSTGPAVPAAPSAGKGVGGPEAMSGAVVANFDSLQAGSVAPASVYTNAAGLPPTSVVFFPHDTTVLNAAGKSQVRAAVQAFQASGGQGFIRVVGHSSSRTANMPVARHLIYNFERSQARANAVARELIAEGVPASKVLVEAVGDSQPVYYESMPQGEEGNRRAEIFVQS